MSQRYLGGIITANPTAPTLTSASGVWTTEQQFQNIANWPKSTGLVSRSVRLRSSATAYFNRTPASATNRTTWTWSGWVKRGAITSDMSLFQGYSDANNYTVIILESADRIQIQNRVAATATFNWTTTAVYRDPSAWYNIVVAFDTTQSTSTDRIKLYVNGVQVTVFTTQVTGAQNATGFINNNNGHNIGRSGAASQYFDGYLTEINFIDGQALTPSYFGFTDGNGVWQPATYSGTYGTNGFYLNFSDNSGVTATTIGKDYSGNGNNWTPNNISVTAGVTYDSMLDSPTPYADGGNGRGNYAALNPLFTSGKAQETITYSQGNLVITSGTTGFWIGTGSTLGSSMSGSFYAELLLTTGVSQGQAFGVVDVTNNAVLSARSGASPYSGICINHTGAVYKNGVNVANVAATTSGDIISIAFDGPNSQVIFKKNNATWYTVTGIPSVDQYVFYGYISDGCSQTWNFGQRPFTYTPPTGFVALNTQNLPDATIKKGNLFFDVVTRAGTGAVATVSSLSFMPDLVWGKARNNPENHNLFDSVRGVTNALRSNTTDAESTQSGVTAFNSNGYSLGAGALNNSGSTYVGWQWNAGGSTVTNTNGSISAQVRANTTAGFSVVTWTSTGANATIGHGLGVAPKMVIVKGRSAVSQWFTWHTGLTSGAYALILNLTDAQASYPTVFNSTTPTSSVFSVGTSLTASTTAVAYCFAAVAGYSAFGSYTGNGSNDGPFIYLGFRPRFVLIKSSTSAENWWLLDSARDPYNVASLYLHPNTSGAESSFATVDFLSNGFKLRYNGAAVNPSGATLIYAAFAENPFKLSRAR